MEVFDGLSMERIVLVKSAADAEIALQDLMSARVVGFDTESKPTFFKGQQSEGPHVLQFATTERAYLFQSHLEDTHPVLIRMLQAGELAKVGFGLGGDLRQIHQRFGIRLAATTDLDRSFRQLGYQNAIGAKTAIAMLFRRRMVKSKSVTTSNWAARELTERQLLYAANDAYAALCVHQAMSDGDSFQKPRKEPGG